MAEFGLGLTKTAVEGTLGLVKSAIEEETKLKALVQNDLVFITSEFEMMQSVLNEANTAERAENQVVRTWVRQLRGLAFDVEDCVEGVANLDGNKSGWWWWRLVPSCIAPPLPLDAALTEIQQIKARVADVNERGTRHGLFIPDNHQSASAGTIATASSSTSTAFNILSQVWEDSGKGRRTGDLKKLITGEGTDLQVISLWKSCSTTGVAADHLGVGATSSSSYIIREAYNDPEIKREFRIRAWVKLMHPFNPVEFINTLLAQFYFNYHQPNIDAHLSEKMKAAGAAMENAELMQQVNMQRYLVVLEDVSSVVEWDAIKMYLPASNNSSRVIVSTQHLRIALMCTGNPYQVSQLRRFSDCQSICAFSKKGSVHRSDIGEFNWQIRRRGVISVKVENDEMILEAHFIRKVYMCIAQKHRAFEAVVFREHSWVDVPNPFDLNDFAVRMFLNFQSSDVKAKELEEVDMAKGYQGVIERCCRYLREADCLVVLNGIKSTEDWDAIKAAFLSGGPSEGTSCIIVITPEETVAAHCVDAQQNRAFRFQAVKDDEVLERLIKNSTGSTSAMENVHRAHLFYSLYKERDYWEDKFKLIGRDNELRALEEKIKNPGVISVWGHQGAGKSVLVRRFYYKVFWKHTPPSLDIRDSSLVNVPHPFNLKDFSWRLLLDFCTAIYDPQDQKEARAVALMEGRGNPIQACCRRLRENMCLVVIDGLRSKENWDQIKNAFFSGQPSESRSRIIVITRKRSVAKHCVDEDNDRLLKVKPFIKDHNSLVGRSQEIQSLVKDRNDVIDVAQNSGGRNLCVTSLWGIAGVGKSALARSTIYDHHPWYSFNKKSWVNVLHPFNLTEFSCRLLLGFYWDDLQAKETAAVGIMEGQDTIQACCQFLCEYKCLIIIDGLTSTHDWDLIKDTFFSEATQSSYIIAITTSESVATHCKSEKSRVHNVKGLNAAYSLDLFTKKARLAPEETVFAKDIVAKCGGLPKVIVAIGEYVAEEILKIPRIYQQETTLATISEDIHHDFMGKLERDSRFHNLKGLFSWMRSYFDACSDALKPCIFYLPVFPADHKRIRRKRLLRRWIAEGYSRDTLGGGTAEEKAEKLFDELVESSIIQQQQTPRSSCSTSSKLNENMWQVNGFFREYIISRPMEDNLVFALEGRCGVNSQRTGQHLTIRSCWDREKIAFESLDFTRLRSLTVFGKWMPFFISCDNNMKLLRVLDLEDTDSGVKDEHLEHIGKLLLRLKFLSLRGCKDITRLPDSLGALVQLQTLDVKHTKIVAMPHTIIKLVNLQYVCAGPISDEGDDTSLPAQDEDDRVSTSSEDNWASSEDEDGTESDNMIAPPVVSADGDNTSTSQLGATSGDGTHHAAAKITDIDDNSQTTKIEQQSAAEDDDGPSTSQAASDTNDTKKSQRQRVAEVADGDDTITSQPTTPDGSGTRQPAAVDGDDTSQLAGEPDTSTSQPAETATDGNGTSKPEAADSHGTGSGSPAAGGNGASTRWSRAQAFVKSYSCSWLSKKKPNDGGVKVPAGIGNMTALHTLGVVKVSGAGGKSVLEEMKKLTQLRKLGVSGINKKNWQDLCSAISGHGLLESLSVRLDKEEDESSFFSSSNDMLYLPKTLNSLKLYAGDGHGNIQVSLDLCKQLIDNLKNLRKVSLELTMATQEDLYSLPELPHNEIFRRLCIKPVEDGELFYVRRIGCEPGKRLDATVLKIDCDRYKLKIAFGIRPGLPGWPRTVGCILRDAEVLVVHCSTAESSLELSGLYFLSGLKEVWLTGSYSEAVKQHLQQEIAEHQGRPKPVLKLEEQSRTS